MEPPKYKIGDLIVISEKFEFGFYNIIAYPGDVGLVSKVLEATPSDYFYTWGHDYYILINGLEFLFFEDELEPYEKRVNKTTKRIKFIL